MKAVFIDIDGTLVVAGENVPPQSALDAIQAARANGHKVFLCTGRSAAMSVAVAAYGFDGAVYSAGGYVVCGDTVLYDRPMPADELNAVLDAMRSDKLLLILEAREATYADDGIQAALGASADANSELIRWRKAIKEGLDARPRSEYDGSPIYKISFLCLDRAALERPMRLLEDRYQFCLQDFFSAASPIVNGELISHAFNKGLGVRRVCDFLGAPMEDSIGFGDSMNDLDMITTVGVGVCMESGSPTLKKHSAMVCPAPERDGLSVAFRELGLI